MKFSRHARSRMKLYKISTEDVLLTVAEYELSEVEGNNTVALKTFEGKYGGYPLKVVFDGALKLIVTVYPLKRKNWSRI